MKRIYMDNAATTRVTPPVLEAMMPCLTDIYGNPSSIHSFGREARRALEAARAQVAAAINAKPAEIYFTGCGTEADNWALRGAAYARKDKGNHIITTAIEHHAVLHTCQQLEREGFSVTYLPVDELGVVKLEELEKPIPPETTLISVMAANNEIGTIEPIAEIGAVAEAHKIPFHTDAVQAFGHIPLDVQGMHISALSLSAHKLGGPKGVGALYLKKGLAAEPVIYGGGQERGHRGGTENVAGIVGLGAAAEASAASMAEDAEALTVLRDRLINELLTVPYSRLTGPREKRLPGHASFCFEGVEGEALVLTLDMLGAAASSGSACSSGSLDPSHVLMAIGLAHEVAHGSLRLTLGPENTAEDAEALITIVKQAVERLRAMSPLWDDMQKNRI